MMMRSQHHHAV